MAENNDPSNIGAATAPSMFGSPSRPALNLVDPNVQQARSEVEMQAKLQAVQALHQLKESQLKVRIAAMQTTCLPSCPGFAPPQRDICSQPEQ
jgi:hypothetical protein